MEEKTTTVIIPEVGDRVLLGMKKRGFGEGKWNGFGGKVHSGESLEDAARRELKEEAGLEGGELIHLGQIIFTLMPENLCLDTHFFSLRSWSGEPIESGEMIPQWFLKDEAIALAAAGKMWQADKLWLPLFLGGMKFFGRVDYENQRLVSSDIGPVIE